MLVFATYVPCSVQRVDAEEVSAVYVSPVRSEAILVYIIYTDFKDSIFLGVD